jgi:tRNA pseudouridine65 synthase
MIVHRDARCVVVDKPSGLATHRGWDGGDDALLQRVRDAVGCYVYPVHRLDRGASGLVVFALDRDAARALAAAWPEADKRYLAVTRGHPPDHAVIDHAIPRAPGEDRVAARTEVWRRETFGRYALVEARLHTGRLHQIRRHLKHISCPLIGDVRYGKGEHNRIFRTEHGLSRLALHCTRIAVGHPDGGALAVDSPLPDDLAAAIASCRRCYAAPEATSDAAPPA